MADRVVRRLLSNPKLVLCFRGAEPTCHVSGGVKLARKSRLKMVIGDRSWYWNLRQVCEVSAAGRHLHDRCPQRGPDADPRK
jgi:hypothetical protein